MPHNTPHTTPHTPLHNTTCTCEFASCAWASSRSACAFASFCACVRCCSPISTRSCSFAACCGEWRKRRGVGGKRGGGQGCEHKMACRGKGLQSAQVQVRLRSVARTHTHMLCSRVAAAIRETADSGPGVHAGYAGASLDQPQQNRTCRCCHSPP